MNISDHTESLPDDGAAYRCCFGTFIGEHWDCPQTTKTAIKAETFARLVIPEGHRVHFHGRAMCTRHIALVLSDYLPA